MNDADEHACVGKRSFGDTVLGTLSDPIAWASALVVAYIGVEVPAAWIADAAGLTQGVTLLEALSGYEMEDAAVTWIGLALLTWIVRLPLVASTLVAAGEVKGTTMQVLQKYGSRAFRTRGIGIMVTGAFALVPLWILAAWRKKSGSDVGPDIAIASVLALCGGWLALCDRFAFARFDAKQDRIAEKKREEGRAGGQYYLDTGNPGRGRGVASGADNAVTDAGWALLSTRALGAVVLVVGLELGVAVAVWSLHSVPSMAVRLGLGTFAGLAAAIVWTQVFARIPR
ncbi:MAG: hypothetical protein SFX73_31755 [Kofleriaceae bacterium]|nr:hypothetical protein [Kofleriaceae bacterium]